MSSDADGAMHPEDWAEVHEELEVGEVPEPEPYMGARTFTMKFGPRGRVEPKYTIDGPEVGKPYYKGQRIRFVMDDGTELDVQHCGDCIEVRSTGRSDEMELGAVNVIPHSSNIVRLRPGRY